MAKRRRKNRSSKQRGDESFLCLFTKVACILLSICWAVVHVYLFFSSAKSPQSDSAQIPSVRKSTTTEKVQSTFPVFHLDPSKLIHDAFGISDTLTAHRDSFRTAINNGGSEFLVDSINLSQFFMEISRLKREFASLYGGENAARYLLHSGITTFQPASPEQNQNLDHIFGEGELKNVPIGLKHTATRILDAMIKNRPFKISFAGYSVTVGRGNYFHQSYPFVLERLLSKPMSLLGIDLQIRNAAIGGVPSFPYGWCLDNFLGEDADVISWDFSMNEAGGIADGLEAYMRHALTMDRQPMMIVKDTSVNISSERQKLLQSYVDVGALKDPVVLSIEDAMETFLRLEEDILPLGLREWRKFGAPKGAPGQAPHHPGVKEHELLGWLLAMHFLTCLEVVASHLPLTLDENSNNSFDLRTKISLPPPIHGKSVNPPDIFSLFYGSSYLSPKNDGKINWNMDPVYCRTSYDPILSGNLKDLVVSGSVGEGLDINLPKGAQFYKSGWVLDLGKNEKAAKKKLERFGGLGYIDSKKAYYGIYGSGPLELFIPCLGREDILQSMLRESSDETHHAMECFKHLVVCEVNEKHTGQECNLGQDLSLVIGGVKSDYIQTVNATGTSYWGRNICISAAIPPEAVLTITRRSQTLEVGVSVQISVANESVTIHSGPCSISHVVWQQ